MLHSGIAYLQHMGRGTPEDGKTRVAFYEDKCLELTVKPYGISVGKI
jgi:hypothetical protein